MSRAGRQWLWFLLIGLGLTPASLPAQDELQKARSQPDPVKRARLALAIAEHAAFRASEACPSGDYEACNFLLDELQASLELTQDSLDRSGIDPNRSPRHFKDAEIRTRKILRQLEAFRPHLHPEDRSHFESVLRRVSEINDKLLSAIMTRRKKK